MSAKTATRLDDRGVLAVGGDDARAFLQGLVTNDMARVGPARAIHAALLSAQGKYLHDFVVVEEAGRFLLDAEGPRLGDLERRLRIYRLRAKVTLAPEPARAVVALAGDGAAAAVGLDDRAGAAGPFAGGIALIDPRHKGLGVRAILPAERWAEAAAAAGFAIAPDRASYEARRIALGVPDGSRDLVVDKSFVMENGFDELNGIDFDKGCYVGQEVTARMKHRALVRKRLLPVTIDGPPPAPGTPVVQGEAEIGEMRSAADGIGLALLRLDRAFAATAPITAGAARLVARRPDWVRLDERSD